MPKLECLWGVNAEKQHLVQEADLQMENKE